MGRCNLSTYDAQRLIQRRLREYEKDGMGVLQTNEGFTLYTNLIRV